MSFLVFLVHESIHFISQDTRLFSSVTIMAFPYAFLTLLRDPNRDSFGSVLYLLSSVKSKSTYNVSQTERRAVGLQIRALCNY
jgi:hypothetical protein